MANIKSAEKRARIAEKNRIRNKAYKSAMRTRIKKFENSLEAEGSGQKSADALKDAAKFIDKLSSKGVIHKNAAARKKSRLQKRLNTAGS